MPTNTISQSTTQLTKSQSTTQQLETITTINNNTTNSLPPTRSDSAGKIVKMENSKLLSDDSDSLLSSSSGTSLDDDTLVTSSTHLLCPGSKKKVQILVTNSNNNNNNNNVARTSKAKTRELSSPTVVIDMSSNDQELCQKEENINKIMMTPYMDTPHPFAMPEGCDEDETHKRYVHGGQTEVKNSTNTIVACVDVSGASILTVTSSSELVSSSSTLPSRVATPSLPTGVLSTPQHLTLPTSRRGNNNNNNNNTNNSVVVSGSVGVASRNHRPLRMASCVSVQSALSTSSSDSSLSDYPPDTPICKFCHQRARPNDQLISPCYCKGSIRHMHCSCLMVKADLKLDH